MFSEDEQEDHGMFDKLRCIRPFTIDQLYLLHPEVSCPPKAAILSEANEHDQNGYKPSQVDLEIYQHLVEFEKLKNQLTDLKHDIKRLYKKTQDTIDDVWTFREESTRKIAMCQQGKIAETTFKYKQAHIDKKHLDKFSQGFNALIEKISKDYIYYSFESQMKRNKVVTHLSISYQTPELEVRRDKLKSAIVTLIEFIRYLGDTKSDFTNQCRKWLRTLTCRFLEGGLTDEYRFIISQLSRGPVGTADWSADLIECKPYEQVSGFDSVPQYITHCSALLSELFYNLQIRIRHIKGSLVVQTEDEHSDNDQTSPHKSSDQNWSLVDPRFCCTEELSISATYNNLLSESDVIKFCLRIPVAQIFRAYVKKCLDSSDEFRLETDKNYESIMLKLLTIGTIIIKTYQIGLETFNRIQYGSLIEYLSSQIRRTVLILSDQWAEFKHRLKGIDDALLMRLQVEYDNFMLRSISVILELRESGIWRHLSRIDRDMDLSEADSSRHAWATDSLRPAFEKLLQATGIPALHQRVNETPNQVTEIKPKHKGERAHLSSSSSLTYEFSVEWFKEVSEPMLWHILWQFYHNGFISSCDYHSDSYWLKKFQEKSVVYLFVNKIRDSPSGERSYLINSITSMLLSRTNHDSKLVNFIAQEIFNLTFTHQTVRDKVNKVGLKALIRSAEKFPDLVSLYISLMRECNIDQHATDLFRGCSLSGWLCNDEELNTFENWLVERPLTEPRNKIARLIISKILLNSPLDRSTSDSHLDNEGQDSELFQDNSKKLRSRKRSLRRSHCFVDLKLRRRLALLLYKASVEHYPENNEFGPQSLGASVELEFGSGLFCQQAGGPRNNLSDLATDSNYQQFYIWTWRLLFSLRLHILNQPETDWNDVQSRSGTSRSTKNTVLVNDPFHPVPSIDDIEFSQLRDGIQTQNPIASYIYLTLTDASWRVDTLESCVTHLNILANSGHITPSLMAMKFLTICHLSDLLNVLIKDKKCIDYFTTIILSNLDANHLASLIATQLDHLKHYRRLQLSHFYVNVFLEVNKNMTKRNATSWFSSNEVHFEKIACLLDYLVRFNFTIHRLEIIRKFYECAYVVQDASPTSGSNNGWLGSFIYSADKDPSTNLHLLSQKFRKYTWLQWVNTECDALRLEKVWEDIVAYLSTNEDATLDSAIKKVCANINASSLRSTLPIFSWIRQIFEIMETDLNHPLCPLIWYNFFLNYFANSLNGVSVGFKLISQDTVTRLLTRLDSLYNYHTYKQRNWSSSSLLQQNSLTSLYKAYKLWLQDPSLRDAYVDIDRLREDYLVPLLKSVMESSQADECLRYIDIQSIELQNSNLTQVWTASMRLAVIHANELDGSIICFDNNELGNQSHEGSLNMEEDIIGNDAVSLIVRSYRSSDNNGQSPDTYHDELARPLSEDSLGEPKYHTAEELMDLTKKNFRLVMEEATIFGLNLSEVERTKSEILELVQQLYINKKKEFVRVVPCVEGNECPGPARIKLEAAEAILDERKSQCIQDRRRQCQELIGELLLMPKSRVVGSTVLIENTLKRLASDPGRAKMVIETILPWLSEPSHYSHLSGSYYVANHLLKTTLELLSTTTETDTYNRAIIDVCLVHPQSVQIFSPHLSPSACSVSLFLELYVLICSRQSALGPTATFVLLSKFDLHSYLDKNSISKQDHHKLIRTTCSALTKAWANEADSSELAFDLFKRHLHIELTSPSRRQPAEFIVVLTEFLRAMSEHTLAPNLWLDYLTIMGLEVNHLRDTLQRGTKQNKMFDGSKITVEMIAEDVARLAETQLIFDYEASSTFMHTISNYMSQAHESTPVALLELHRDYLEQFGMVMLTTTFIWLKWVCTPHSDNHELAWKRFIDLWRHWILLAKNCQNVSKSTYTLAASFFVVSLRYMIHKSPQNTCAILQSMLFELTNYVSQTREVIHLELTILQGCLKALPWSSLIFTPSDIDNLAALCEQDYYNLSDLVSHVLSQMDTRVSLSKLHHSEPACLPHVVERLATMIVLNSSLLRGYKLYSRYFSQLPQDDIPRLVGLILARTEFNNLENSANNRLLFRLLRYICVDPGTLNSSESPDGSLSTDYQHTTAEPPTQKFERALIYARFISSYLVDLIRRHPAVINSNKKYLNNVIDESLIDLEPLISSQELDICQKTALYASMLEFCCCDAIESNFRLSLALSVVESHVLRDKPKLVVGLIKAISQSLKDGRVLVLMIERLVDLYHNINGLYEKIWANFNLQSIGDEHYLQACVDERAPMALMVYFESLFNSNRQSGSSSGGNCPPSHGQDLKPLTTNQIWSSFFQWLTKLTQSLSNLKSFGQYESKLTTAWVRVLELFEADIRQYLIGNLDCNVEDSGSSNDSNTLKHDHSENQDKSTVCSSDQEPTRTSETDSLCEKVSSKESTVSNTRRRSLEAKASLLQADHKFLSSFIKQMISFYDSTNSSGLWSYLMSSTKSEASCKVSVTGLAIACFLANRALAQLNHLSASDAGAGTEGTASSLVAQRFLLRDELAKLLRLSVSRLEAARKSKSLTDSSQFLETLLESVQQHERVQYSEGVQLIKTYARAH